MEESCCTCAKLIKNILLQYDEKSEKPKALDRRLDCCGRIICGNCIADNSRFATYCRNATLPKHRSLLTMQALSVKSQQPRLRCLRASEIHLHIPQPLLRNHKFSPKIRQHIPTSFRRTLPSRIYKLRHQRRVRVHNPRTSFTF